MDGGESSDHDLTENSDLFTEDGPDEETPNTSSPKNPRRTYSRDTQPPPASISTIKPKIDSIQHTLKGTNRNLNSVDRMLSSYRTVNESQLDSMERLRRDLNKTMDELKEERVKSSLRIQEEDNAAATRMKRRPREFGTKDYSSDGEYSSPVSRGPRRTVAYADTSSASVDPIHELHSSLRDLTAEHEQMKEQMNREISRRNREEQEAKKNMTEISDSVRRTTHDTSSSVEKRLSAIQDELRSERRYTDQKRNEMGRLSSELRQALSGTQPQTVNVPVDDAWRQRVNSAEMSRKQVENELENLKRKFDQAEGSKAALMRQIDELRHQLASAERERTQLRNRVEEMKSEEEVREKRRLKVSQEEKEGERRAMDKEIEELKLALTRSTQQGSAELEDMKRLLERTERQKSQLQDQNEALKKDLDNKEKYTLKMMDELQESKSGHDECERQRNCAITQLEDAVRQLRDSTREVSQLSDSLKETERQLRETEKKKEEMRVKAQETVKMWKMKCKRVEKELDKQQEDSSQSQRKLCEVSRDHEALKVQSNTMCVQLDNMKREMADILAVRASQEEQLRLKDNELYESKTARCELEKEVADCRCMVEKLKEDLQVCEVSITTSREDRNHLDEKLSNATATMLVAQDENKQLRKEIQELSTCKAEVSAQLNEVLTQRQELKKNVNEARRTEHELREEIGVLTKQSKEESDYHQAALIDLKERMNQQKERDGKTVQDLAHRLKRDKAEYEAQIQALKIECAEERANAKILKRQEEKCKLELERVHEHLNQYEDDNSRLRRRMTKHQKEMESKLQVADDDINRARKTEEDLFTTQESERKLRRDFCTILRTIGSEINGVVDAVSFGASDTFGAITTDRFLPNDPQGWLAEMKSKLAWLRSEILDHQVRERRLKLSVQDVVEESEQDKRELLSELHKHQDVVVGLLDERDTLEASERKKLDEVLTLEEQVNELSTSLRYQQDETLRRSLEIAKEKRQIANELRDMKSSQKEKDRIHERYRKLQAMVNSLREELADTKHLALDHSTERLNARSPSPILRSSSPIGCRSPSPILRSHSPYRSTSPPRSLHTTSSPLRCSSPFRRAKTSTNTSTSHRPRHTGHSATSRRRVRINESRANHVTDDRAGGDCTRFSSDRDSSPTRDRSRSPVPATKQQKPLDMSDDEFKQKFIPKAYKLTDSIDDL